MDITLPVSMDYERQPRNQQTASPRQHSNDLYAQSSPKYFVRSLDLPINWPLISRQPLENRCMLRPPTSTALKAQNSQTDIGAIYVRVVKDKIKNPIRVLSG